MKNLSGVFWLPAYLHLNNNMLLISKFLDSSKSQLFRELYFPLFLVVVQTLGTFSVCGNVADHLQFHSCPFLCSSTTIHLKLYHLKFCSLDVKLSILLKFILVANVHEELRGTVSSFSFQVMCSSSFLKQDFNRVVHQCIVLWLELRISIPVILMEDLFLRHNRFITVKWWRKKKKTYHLASKPK